MACPAVYLQLHSNLPHISLRLCSERVAPACRAASSSSSSSSRSPLRVFVQCFLSFAVEVDDLGSRLQVNVTLVLTAIAFKFVVVEHLPVINYQTYLGEDGLPRCAVGLETSLLLADWRLCTAGSWKACLCAARGFTRLHRAAVCAPCRSRAADRYILFSLAFMVLIASENSIVKAVKDSGDEYVAWLLEQIVLVGGGIVWVIVHACILAVYCAPDLIRKKWEQINVVY